MWGDYWMMSKFDTRHGRLDFMVGPDPDATDFFSSRRSAPRAAAGQNTTQYKNPEVDKLLAEGATTVDRAKRKATYQKMQADHAPRPALLPIFQYAHGRGHEGRAAGFRPTSTCRRTAGTPTMVLGDLRHAA